MRDKKERFLNMLKGLGVSQEEIDFYDQGVRPITQPATIFQRNGALTKKGEEENKKLRQAAENFRARLSKMRSRGKKNASKKA